MWKLIRRILLVALLVAVVLNWTWGRLPGAPPPPAGSHYAQVDGKRIHYVEQPGREPAVVMVHGLPGTWGDWNAVAAELKGRRTIQIDRPGYAFSTEGYVPFDEQVGMIHDFAKELKLKDPVIAGHSYGGSLALVYGKRYPGDVSGIVAVDPAVDTNDVSTERMFQAGFIKATQVPVVKQVLDLTVSQLVRTVSAEMGGNDAFSPDARDQGWLDRALSLNMRQRDLDTWSDEMLNSEGPLREVAASLPDIRPKVWFIQGEQDELVSASAVTAAAKEVPKSSLKLLPGGHMQTYTHPGQVAAAITAAAR